MPQSSFQDSRERKRGLLGEREHRAQPEPPLTLNSYAEAPQASSMFVLNKRLLVMSSNTRRGVLARYPLMLFRNVSRHP